MTRQAVVLTLASSIAGALFALGCAGASSSLMGGSRPEWVSGQKSELSAYPSAAFVTGVGIGETDEAARQSARAEISKIFQSRVEADHSDSRQLTRSEQAGREQVSVTENLKIETRITSSGTFEGIHIPETWHDTRAGSWYALAVLDKHKTRKVLLEQLRDAADRTYGDLVRSDAAVTNLGRSRALVAAARSRAEVDAIVSRARIVGRPHVLDLPGTGVIQSELAETLANTRFQVRAVEIDPTTGRERGGLPKLQQELAKTITGIGFKVVRPGSSAGSPNVWLECRMSLQEIERNLDTHFVRWEGSFELTGPPPNGAVMLSAKGSGGESFSSVSLARTRAVMKGSAKLSRELKGQITRYLSGDAGH